MTKGQKREMQREGYILHRSVTRKRDKALSELVTRNPKPKAETLNPEPGTAQTPLDLGAATSVLCGWDEMLSEPWVRS
jgi:hypothetical protein